MRAAKVEPTGGATHQRLYAMLRRKARSSDMVEPSATGTLPGTIPSSASGMISKPSTSLPAKSCDSTTESAAISESVSHGTSTKQPFCRMLKQVRAVAAHERGLYESFDDCVAAAERVPSSAPSLPTLGVCEPRLAGRVWALDEVAEARSSSKLEGDAQPSSLTEPCIREPRCREARRCCTKLCLSEESWRTREPRWEAHLVVAGGAGCCVAARVTWTASASGTAGVGWLIDLAARRPAASVRQKLKNKS